jgi:putative FmdB family regulatory protein
MPLYEYECEECGFEFEELVKSSEEPSCCKKCNGSIKRKMSRCAAVISGGTPVETVDMTIGRAAEKQWQMRNDTQAKRRNVADLKPIDLPKDNNGKFMPVMGLGDSKARESRKDYVGALQNHRKERIKKGQPQFDGVGAW